MWYMYVYATCMASTKWSTYWVTACPTGWMGKCNNNSDKSNSAHNQQQGQQQNVCNKIQRQHNMRRKPTIGLFLLPIS